MDPKNSLGETPLFAAAYFGHVEMVKLLLNHSADIHAMDVDGMMPIHIAAYFGDLAVVETLIELGEDVDAVSDFYQFTPLHIAAYYGYADIVEYLLEMGADCDILGDYETTALDLASDYGGDEVVEVLNNGCG